jgi:hypothetical protein
MACKNWTCMRYHEDNPKTQFVPKNSKEDPNWECDEVQSALTQKCTPQRCYNYTYTLNRLRLIA